MSSESTGQLTLEKLDGMGVASVSSKRRLENGEVSEQDSPVSKIAKKNIFTESYSHAQDTIVHETSSSDFLTTSILARTLLTGSCSSSSNESLVHVPSASASSPLDSLKSSLEAMPAPAFMESLHELGGNISTFQQHHHQNNNNNKSTTIDESTELEFTNLLCHETSLATVTILSPIDEDSNEWRANGTIKHSSKTQSHSILIDQVITEDENGKSYFNLGPSDATILAKKSSSNFISTDQNWMITNGSSSGNNNNNSNSNNNGDIDLMDDTSSSSSCDSISSEDLFNSCEEFDPSDDEEEVRTYKQERSTVLHLSLCKLNMFRTHCLEPSLRRSVLICNTLRQIEQEIRSEDEIKGCNNNGSTCVNLESRETLPPFWPSSRNSNHHHHQRVEQQQQQQQETLPVPDMNPQQGHDPYLSSNSYNNESPYTSYDYNSLRPSQTPFHAASYDDYPESDLTLGNTTVTGVNPNGTPILTELVSNSPPTLLECDSGYAEDMELSSYYYSGSSSPNEFSTASVIMDTTAGVVGYCQQEVIVPHILGGIGSIGTETTAVVTVGGQESSCQNGGDMSDINSTDGSGTRILGVLSCQTMTSDIMENINNNIIISSSSSNSTINGGKYLDVTNEIVGGTTTSDIIHCWPSSSNEMILSTTTTTAATTTATATTTQQQQQQQQYAQQEGQCGLESRLSDYGGYGSHQQLPMDSLVSTTYSSLS